MARAVVPGGRSTRLPSPRVQAAVWCVTAVGTVAAMVLLEPLHAPAVGWPSFVFLAALTLVAAHQGLWARMQADGRTVQESVDLDEVTLVLLLLFLEGPWVLAVAITSYAIALLGNRPPALKATFNIASRTTTTGLAVAIASPMLETPVPSLSPLAVAVVAAAVLAHITLNFLSVKFVIAAVTGATVRHTISTTAELNIVMWVGNATLGVAAAALWLQHPALVLVAAVLATIVRRAYRTVVVVNGLNDELGLERDRLRRLVDGARDGILQLDVEGAVVSWNPALELLTGVTGEAAVGASVDELLDGRLVVEQGPATLAAAVTLGLPPDDQVLRLRAPGGERSLVARHALQHDRDGHLVGDIVQLHDRTAMERADRIEHDFLSRVTHELLTPLTIIRGVTQTVLGRADRLDAGMRAQLLERLGSHAAHMEGLVHDLLAVGSLRRRPGTASPAPHDLMTLVRAAVATEGERWEGRTIEVAGRPVQATLDPSAVHTVVRHLVRNALNYSADDSTVTVALEVEDAAHVVLRVRDTGRGIPASRIDEMFAAFTRMEDPLRMETRGIGLGLFLVRQLVGEMGGHVSVASAPGEGSTFEVELPITALAEDTTQASLGTGPATTAS